MAEHMPHFSGVTHVLLGAKARSGVMDSLHPAAGQPPALGVLHHPGWDGTMWQGRSHFWVTTVPVEEQ